MTKNTPAPAVATVTKPAVVSASSELTYDDMLNELEAIVSDAGERIQQEEQNW